MSKVVVLGGTGLIGKRLAKALSERGDQVIILSRKALPNQGLGERISIVRYPESEQDWTALLKDLDGSRAIVNLAGEGVADRRWTDERKKEILESRVGSTRKAVEIIRRLGENIQKERVGGTVPVLINGSAIGFYGPHADREFVESDGPGIDFLSRVCFLWEAEALKAASAGVRVVLLRIGIVLSADGGALAKMLPVFKLGGGGTVGSGKQWMSWIHIDDVVGLILHSIDHPEVSGAVNVVAPQPVQNEVFTKTLARVLNRPAIIPVPGFALKMALGEFSMVLLEGQKVIPTVAGQVGYKYRYPELDKAFENILQ
jgi:uncharacterized protein